LVGVCCVALAGAANTELVTNARVRRSAEIGKIRWKLYNMDCRRKRW
jgi:hypothetical protein